MQIVRVAEGDGRDGDLQDSQQKQTTDKPSIESPNHGRTSESFFSSLPTPFQLADRPLDPRADVAVRLRGEDSVQEGDQRRVLLPAEDLGGLGPDGGR